MGDVEVLVFTYSNFPPCVYFFLECPFSFRFSLVMHLSCGFVDNPTDPWD